jgi:hypothetical protein
MTTTTRYAACKGRWNEAGPYVVVNTATDEIVAGFASISEASYHATTLNPAPADPFEGLA